MRKTTQAEFDALKNNYNELRSLCDSYLKEIKELERVITVFQRKCPMTPSEIWNEMNRIS